MGVYIQCRDHDNLYYNSQYLLNVFYVPSIVVRGLHTLNSFNPHNNSVSYDDYPLDRCGS